jgi:UDP-N-acetyl-D-glucosamine dehydrogenase
LERAEGIALGLVGLDPVLDNNPDPADNLQHLINSNRAVVAVIGLGYVGLPLAYALHQGGMPIMGFDVDSRKIDCINQKKNYLSHLGDELVSTLADSNRFTATTDFSLLDDCDVIIICDGTRHVLHPHLGRCHWTDAPPRPTGDS